MENFRQLLFKTYAQTNQFGKLMGAELINTSAEGIEYRLIIDEKHLATPTTAHGGVISALMDGVLGVAALYVSSEDGNLVSTVEFKINYLQPVLKGDILIGKGKVISAGKRLIIAQGEISCENSGKKVAIATGTFNAYPHEKSGMTLEDLDFNSK
jgi:uncharacterized protein (TIGR00369 family)